MTLHALNLESHHPASNFSILPFFNNFMVCTCVSVSSLSPHKWETVHLTISVSNLYDFTSFFVTKPGTVRAAKMIKTWDPASPDMDLPFFDSPLSAFSLCVWWQISVCFVVTECNIFMHEQGALIDIDRAFQQLFYGLWMLGHKHRQSQSSKNQPGIQMRLAPTRLPLTTHHDPMLRTPVYGHEFQLALSRQSETFFCMCRVHWST